MYCGAMRPFASLADGALRARCFVVKRYIFHAGGRSCPVRTRPHALRATPCRSRRSESAARCLPTLEPGTLDVCPASAAPTPPATGGWRRSSLPCTRGMAGEAVEPLSGSTTVRLERHELVVGREAGRPPLRLAFGSDFHLGPTTHRATLDNAFRLLREARPDVLLLGATTCSSRDAGPRERAERPRQQRPRRPEDRGARQPRLLGPPGPSGGGPQRCRHRDSRERGPAPAPAARRRRHRRARRSVHFARRGRLRLTPARGGRSAREDRRRQGSHRGLSLAGRPPLGAGPGRASPALRAHARRPRRLARFRPIWIPSPVGKRYPWGRHEVDGTSIFVSRGVRGSLVPFRTWRLRTSRCSTCADRRNRNPRPPRLERERPHFVPAAGGEETPCWLWWRWP